MIYHAPTIERKPTADEIMHAVRDSGPKRTPTGAPICLQLSRDERAASAQLLQEILGMSLSEISKTLRYQHASSANNILRRATGNVAKLKIKASDALIERGLA